MQENYITHLHLLLDASGSMQKHSKNVVNLLDMQILHWSNRAKELNQTVKASIYFFDSKVRCVVFDEDISKIKNVGKLYKAEGNTAFLDANIEAIDSGLDISEKYGNHSHLLTCFSDGENNVNNNKVSLLKNKIGKLPDNWTISCSVPNANAAHEAKMFGFPANNIQIWDCNSEDGFEEASNKFSHATNHYLIGRSRGMTSTKSLFNLDASIIDNNKVKRNLNQLSPHEYELLSVNKESYIKDFIESWKLPFVKGANYYQITKPETIQAYKNIIVQDKVNGKVYAGIHGREILGLPNFDVKVNPLTWGQYNLFIQSSSSNRKLVRGTQLIILK